MLYGKSIKSIVEGRIALGELEDELTNKEFDLYVNYKTAQEKPVFRDYINENIERPLLVNVYIAITIYFYYSYWK